MSIFNHDPKHVKAIPRVERIPVLVMEDNGDAHIHGLVLAPRPMTLARAKEAITQAFVEIRKANEEEWNYEDLEKLLRQRGFLFLSVGLWEENQDGYPLEDGKQCVRCGTDLEDDLCGDETCPFSDHEQTCMVGWSGHPERDPNHKDDGVGPCTACTCGAKTVTVSKG